jgi:hypothetical protein
MRDRNRVILAVSLFECWKLVGSEPKLQARLEGALIIVGLDEIAELLDIPVPKVERILETCLQDGLVQGRVAR